jgi:anaerobic ribonucleoside-triphosphate reductase activating protein
MLKYLNYDIVFQEVPFEMSLAVSISGCIQHCYGCHSRELWEDKGDELSIFAIEQLLKKEDGVTCLLLMGGEHDIDTLVEIFMHFHRKIKTAWYCGLDMIPKDKLGIVQYLDFLKVGHFDMELGGLDSPTTNQRLYKIEHQGDGNYYQTDITHLMQRK